MREVRLVGYIGDRSPRKNPVNLEKITNFKAPWDVMECQVATCFKAPGVSLAVFRILPLYEPSGHLGDMHEVSLEPVHDSDAILFS